MDIKKLKTFLKVAELQSFSKAAEQLGFTQSGASKHVQELEAELGFALFDRSSKKIILTELGALLAPAFEKQLRELEHIIQNAKSKHEDDADRLHRS